VKRVALILGLMLAGLPAAVAHADAPRSHLGLFVCQRALDPAQRGMSITAVMRPLTGTKNMQMRFELLQRAHLGGKATSLPGKQLKTWITPPNPTLGQLPGDVWIVHHPVVDLAAPFVYRYRVTFRWIGTGGTVLATFVRISRACREPELRPDLVVSQVAIIPLSGGQDRYAVLVANHGKTAAGPFTLQLTIGTQVLSQTVPGLAPITHMTIRFSAPACVAPEQLTAIADPGPPYQIDDFNRTNNTWAEICPSAAAPASRKAVRGR
jgi:hypothetical protein